ncbi:osteopetrosis-associated transmembrane protein 1 [Solea solea]|uniref:osteopetrosis-associated transmembrane protein 1 n=1 Tax=Solea solea TaxID=90069 RepID=UPI00272A50D4|nr:osteopetrosis-associated transmembrane protein 1 [Solea solea]
MLSLSLSCFPTMFLSTHCPFFVLLVTHFYPRVSGNTVDLGAADLADKARQFPAVFEPAPGGSSSSLSLLLSSFPGDLEISEYCRDQLLIFGQRYEAYVKCLVPAARPVKVCENCFSSYVNLNETYTNITDQVGPGNVSCRDSLLRSDRLMVVFVLFNNLKDLWEKSGCSHCITKGFQGLTNDTLAFMTMLNQTQTCFDTYRQGNHTELCQKCKNTYKDLNELYRTLEMDLNMCIDVEDAMNITRRIWSKTFNCSLPREETVPVIAVSSFMLFLPIIFYLSSFLHSEQKKRKLIHPKRAKSYNSLMNIQDKQN